MKNVAWTYTSIPAIRANFQDQGVAMSLSMIVQRGSQPGGRGMFSGTNFVLAGRKLQDDLDSLLLVFSLGCFVCAA
jgi:hypothetical protein